MKPIYWPINSMIIAAVTALATAGTAYSFDVQYECTTNGTGGWRVVASAPTSIVCPGAEGACTLMQYTVTPLRTTCGNQDHVAVLVAQELTVVNVSNSVTVYPACDGDTLTYLGIRDCSTKAVRLNTKSATQTYDLIVAGEAVATDSSIVIKKGRSLIEECRIAGLGTPPPPVCDPKAQQTSKETFTFKDCEIEIAIDPCTGESGAATVVSGDCVVDEQPVESLQLVINGVTQNVTTGDGWISSGDTSCTTKINRLTKQAYTVCDCKTASDPSPPCP